MTDISILVDYDQVQKANREILNIGSNAEKSARVFERAFARAERASRSKLTQTKQTASNELALYKQKEAALAKEAALMERLASKYKPLYAASKLYSTTLEEINQAHKLGVLNTQQHAAAVDNLNKEYTEFGNGTANSLNMFNQGLSRSNRGISHMSVLTQQAGYQIGDFIVQVQSGTNAFVAFGQQATQIAGTLTLLGGKWVGIGTALGIAIPLATAVGAALSRTAREAEDTTDSFSDLSESINNLEKYSTNLINTNQKVKDSFKSLLSVVREVEGIALQQALDEILVPFENKIRDYEKRFANFRRFGGFGFEEPNFEALGFEDLDRAVQAYELLTQIQGDSKEEIAESLRLTELWLRGSGLLTDEIKVLLSEYAKAVDIQDFVTENIQEAVSRQTTLNEETRIYIEEMSEVFLRTQELTDELGEAGFQALRLSGIDIASPISDATMEAARLAGQMGIAVTQAFNFMNALNAAQAAATRTMEGAANAQAAYSLYVATGGNPEGPGSTVGTPLTSAGAVAPPRSRLPEFQISRSRSSGGRSSGGSSARPRETAADYIKSLTDEIDRKKQLIGLFGEERDIKERTLQLMKQAQDKEFEISESRLRAIALEEQRVEESLSRQEDLYNNLHGGIEDALMSLVQGSQNAGQVIRSVLADIALEAYKENIVSPVAKSLTSSLFGLLPFANGGAIQNGRVIPFANGGVVTGPTTFPMSGGTGLMGEAGPEAIMPLKRGPNGQLGVQAQQSSQPINVTFNISTPDVKGFNRSKAQIAASMQGTLQAAKRNA